MNQLGSSHAQEKESASTYVKMLEEEKKSYKRAQVGIKAMTKAEKQLQERKRRRIQQPESDSEDEDGEWSGDSELNSEAEAALDELLADSATEGTLAVDKSHWRSWTAAATRLRLSPWRAVGRRRSSYRHPERCCRRCALATTMPT